MKDYQPLQYLYYPAPEPATRTLLLLHGNAGNENDLLPLAEHFGSHFNVLSLRGNVSEGGYNRFFNRIGMGIPDKEDLVYRAHELVQFVRQLSETSGFYSNQILAVGYSSGATLAGAVLMLYPELLAGAVLWRPRPVLEQQLPNFATSRRQPVLLSPGLQDLSVQRRASKRYAALLHAAGYNVKLQFTDAGHRLTQADMQTVYNWTRQHFPEKRRHWEKDHSL
jgi:phospholipase/carboxylesterase